MLMTIPYSKTYDNVNAVVKTLRIYAGKLFKWLKNNQIKRNTDKCHLLLNTGELNIYMEAVFNRCTLIKPLRIKKYWKRIDQPLFTIKSIGVLNVEMFKIKDSIFSATGSDNRENCIKN